MAWNIINNDEIQYQPMVTGLCEIRLGKRDNLPNRPPSRMLNGSGFDLSSKRRWYSDVDGVHFNLIK